MLGRTSFTAAGAALGALICAIALTACTAGGDNSTTPTKSVRQQTVVIGTGEIPQTLDPVQASNAQVDFTVRAMYDTLTSFTPDGKLEPAVATQWKFNSNATSLEVTLRSDVTFHDGSKLTAADVAYTLDRTKQLNVGAAAFIATYASAKVADDTHLTITLSKPTTTFPQALSKIYILNEALVKKEGSAADSGQQWLATHDAGSGAFTLTSYTAKQTAQFDRYAHYWAYEATRPAYLQFTYLSDSATIREEMQAGDLDLATGTSLATVDLNALKADAQFTVTNLQTPSQMYAMMNVQKGVTADEKVRQAIQLAIDYKGFLASVLGGNGHLSTGIVRSTVQCSVDTGTGEQNVAEAKQLIAEAGAAGKTVTMAYQSTVPTHQKLATLLQSNLQAIGLNVQLQSVTYPQYLALLQSKDTIPELAVVQDSPKYPAVGPFLTQHWTTASIGLGNYSAYSNPQVDQLLAQANSTVDESAACSDYQQAQKLIAADRTSANIVALDISIVARKGISGITYDPARSLLNVTNIRVS